MSKISVVIPCYNVEPYLSECLDSVFNQTFRDLEVICVEDCSTDKTKDILKKYTKKYKNIRVFYNKTNQGLAVSRNIGLKNTSSDYIYFLDSDDTITQDCLEKLYNKISKDKSDIVVGSIKTYPEDKNDENCVRRSKDLQDWVKIDDISKLKITEKNSDEYYYKIYTCSVNKLYSKNFLVTNDISFINKKCFHEDNGFWLKILSCNPIISCVSSCTYLYRIHNCSITDVTQYDKKLRVSHVKNSLKDALCFTKSKGKKVLSNFIYYEIYTLRKHRLFYLVWTKFEKRLKILSYPIFGLKFDMNKKMYKLKILGIPIYRWRKK